MCSRSNWESNTPAERIFHSGQVTYPFLVIPGSRNGGERESETSQSETGPKPTDFTTNGYTATFGFRNPDTDLKTHKVAKNLAI